jgi:hypothetical protein
MQVPTRASRELAVQVPSPTCGRGLHESPLTEGKADSNPLSLRERVRVRVELLQPQKKPATGAGFAVSMN